MKRWILLSAASIGMSGLAIHAHHSIAGAYDSTQSVTLQGIITNFQFVNPHPFVVLKVSAADGSTEQWRLEMDNRRELSQIGMTSETLKQGDLIIVTGDLARSQPQSLYIRKLDRPADGYGHDQVGNRRRGRTTR